MSRHVRIHSSLVVCMDPFLAWPMMRAFGAKSRIVTRDVSQSPCYVAAPHLHCSAYGQWWCSRHTASCKMHVFTKAFWQIAWGLCVTRRKQHQPGTAPNANTTHVPTAGSGAAPTKPNHTPTRHPRAKGKILLKMVTPHACLSCSCGSESAAVNEGALQVVKVWPRASSCVRVLV